MADSPTKPALKGGAPICKVSWPKWPHWDDTERRLLMQVLDSGKWWFGDRAHQFECEFAQFQGARYGVTCTNGTTAIEMALRALGIVEGDEVIVPCYTFIATASAVVTVGAIPVFADIRSDSLCLDAEDVLRKITPRTRAILPVHLGGCMVDMDRLGPIAQNRGLPLVEDSAHAWGSQWRGRGAGTLGQCGTFSFQLSKNITSGEGGIMVTDDEEFAELCRSYTNFGRKKDSEWYAHEYAGSNLRLSEFQAAVLIAQLSRAQEQLQRRQASAAILDRLLSPVKGLLPLAPEARMTRRSYHMYIFRVDESVLGISRDRFIEALIAEGVPASKGYNWPLYHNAVFRQGHSGPPHAIKAPFAGKGVDYRDVHCPVCEQVCRDAVWIPQRVLLADEEEIRALATAVIKVASQASDLE